VTHSVCRLAVAAWCLLPSALGAAAREDYAATGDVSRARAEELSKELDELVVTAAKGARGQLPERVTSAEHALKHAPDEYRLMGYRVLDHKGWWVVVWQPDGCAPALWFHGVAIRKNSKDIYHFGAW
jgi:hypothetical protein